MNMPLGEWMRDNIWSVHENIHEFSIHIKGDINLSMYSFSEICTREYYGSRIFKYMKMMCRCRGLQQN
jgi:hypothetical protein